MRAKTVSAQPRLGGGVRTSGLQTGFGPYLLFIISSQAKPIHYSFFPRPPLSGYLHHHYNNPGLCRLPATPPPPWEYHHATYTSNILSPSEGGRMGQTPVPPQASRVGRIQTRSSPHHGLRAHDRYRRRLLRILRIRVVNFRYPHSSKSQLQRPPRLTAAEIKKLDGMIGDCLLVLSQDLFEPSASKLIEWLVRHFR